MTVIDRHQIEILRRAQAGKHRGRSAVALYSLQHEIADCSCFASSNRRARARTS